MAFVTRTVTGNLYAMFGDAIDITTVRGYADTNLGSGDALIYDLDNDRQYLGSGTLTIESDGSWALSGVPDWNNTEADQNPTGVQVQVHFEYTDKATQKRKRWDSGFLEVDADGSIGTFAAQQLAPADWRSDFMDQAEALLAAQVDISNIEIDDDVVETLVLNTGGAGPKTSAALSATIGQVKAWAKDPDNLVTGAITLDGDDLVTSAVVKWPDGLPGVLTITSRDSNDAVLSYNITRVDGATTTTYTQPAITRNANGVATNVPEMVVS